MSTAPRIAILGLLGSGNLGNHASFEAMLGFLREQHPDSPITCVCSGPEEVRRQYGIPSMSITWYEPRRAGRGRLSSRAAKAFGKVADLVRTPLWVRKYDIVIVPGMGVLETTLQLRPWGWPYALFLVFLSGRLLGTRTALVDVGANVTRELSIRWLFGTTARLATYRSYRDEPSRQALATMGVDVSGDEVYPDLAFALPRPPAAPGAPSRTVALGVMAYRGANADRDRSDEVYTGYVGRITEFARWLVDEGYRVRLITGDPSDQEVVSAVVDDLRRTRPGLADERLVNEPAASFGELMDQLAGVDLVVASRFHNVLAALKLAIPTISISYAAKNDVLLAETRLAEFRQPIQSLDVQRLIEQFRALELRAPQLRPEIEHKLTEYTDALGRQYGELSSALFGPVRRHRIHALIKEA
ncbi:polysaccharide pyruvyl transferase family protein [Kribbella lupini]|uniref:Polysaccharide pyruvyl transferase family protein n=1 Tax=Kribbella lupini TaxID=291602 RepID=A0ABP4L1M3_9ACTN